MIYTIPNGYCQFGLVHTLVTLHMYLACIHVSKQHEYDDLSYRLPHVSAHHITVEKNELHQ